MSPKPKRERQDVHHTISLDKIASEQIKEMAADLGNNISATFISLPKTGDIMWLGHKLNKATLKATIGPNIGIG
jgi:hypothetical protein